MMIRFFVLFIISILSIQANGQDCLFPVKLRGGDTVRINSINLKYMTESTSTATIVIYGDTRTAYIVEEAIGDIVARTNGTAVLFTDEKTNKGIAISRSFLLEVRETPDNKAFFFGVDARFRWKSVEAFSSLRTALEICASGSGGLLYGGGNVGSGTGEVYKQTNGTTHEFREIIGDEVISVTTNGDNIELSSLAMDTIETTPEFNGPIARGATLQLMDNQVSGFRLTESTVPGSKLQDDAVTYDKMQNISGLRILGKPDAGVGQIQEIELGSGLQFNGNAIEATPSAGTNPYDAGDDGYVKANSSGVTFTKASGVGTLAIPLGNSFSYLRINGDAADLAGDGSFTVVLDYDVTVSWNQSLATYMPPLTGVINTAAQAGGGPNASFPFIYDEGSSPRPTVVGVAGGDLTLKWDSMSDFTDWSIIIIMFNN